MKKIFLGLSIVLLSGALSSCYNTKVACGDHISNQTPVVKVKSQWNHHFVFGLLPGGKTKMEARNYVNDADNYLIKTNQSLFNGLLSIITFGLYSPTTTTFYVPTKEVKK